MEYNYGVTVYCLTYNHEKYIRKCLQGFVEQKTNFPIQVIVHDDASTDHTADIIREYEQNYPQIIYPIYQSVNQYSQGVNIKKKYIAPLIQGKYVAMCEGDDYWCDSNKLQRQYDALEKNPQCYSSVHTVKLISEDGNETGMLKGKTFENAQIIDQHTFLDNVLKYWSYHTSSYFFRTSNFLDLVYNPPEYLNMLPFGDDQCMLYFGQLGDVYFFPEVMSCYRVLSENGFTMRYNHASKQYRINLSKTYITAYTEFDKYTQYQYHDSCNYAIKKNKLRIAINTNDAKETLSRKYKDVASLKTRIIMLLDINYPIITKIIRPIFQKIKKIIKVRINAR